MRKLYEQYDFVRIAVEEIKIINIKFGFFNINFNIKYKYIAYKSNLISNVNYLSN